MNKSENFFITRLVPQCIHALELLTKKLTLFYLDTLQSSNPDTLKVNDFKIERERDIGAVEQERIMQRLKSLRSEYDQGDFLDLLEYYIDTLLHDACTHPAFLGLAGTPAPVVSSPLPLKYFNEKGEVFPTYSEEKVEVALSSSKIYTFPWNYTRTARGIIALRDQDFKYIPTNHECLYIPEFDLCFVINGKHSINAGKYYKKGIVYGTIWRIEPLFPHVETDGKKWYNKYSHECLADVYDFRIATAYTLAQMCWEIKHKGDKTEHGETGKTFRPE